jgi:large subunit ribosomal protein L13
MSYGSGPTLLPQRGSDLSRTTRALRPEDVRREWCLINAQGLVLGRLATVIATRLRGKHKAVYTPHVDCGDAVIVINAEKVALTGGKYDRKTYFHHTGYAGGVRARTAKQVLEGAHPERVLEKAVERMLGEGPLAEQQFSHLYVYGGADHPHHGQQPRPLDIGSLNPKNVKGQVMAKNPGFTREFEKALDDRLLPFEERVSAQFQALADAIRQNAADTHDILKQLRDKAADDERRFEASEKHAEADREAMQNLAAAIKNLADRLEPR